MSNERQTRVTEPRSDETPEWEVFVRTDEAEPLRHVGSVSAPSEAVAHEQASSLFGWTAEALWLCRADDVVRRSARDLGAGEARRAGGPQADGGATAAGGEDR